MLPLVVNSAVSQPIALVPQADAAPPAGRTQALGSSGGVRSARPDYATLPDKARAVIDMALFMLGDDAQVFDALPPDLRKMCYGSTFLAINSHQPDTGPVAWYEAHLHSEQGWDMYGGLVPGMPVTASR